MKVMRWVWLWLLVLVLFSPLFVTEAKAQTPVPTDTPTPTYQPLFPTGTPQPTRSYDCPEGLPAGWGTATPQGWWSMSCMRCLMALTPTATLEATWTPVPLPTNTPGGPTSTPVPTESPYDEVWILPYEYVEEFPHPSSPAIVARTFSIEFPAEAIGQRVLGLLFRVETQGTDLEFAGHDTGPRNIIGGGAGPFASGSYAYYPSGHDNSGLYVVIPDWLALLTYAPGAFPTLDEYNGFIASLGRNHSTGGIGVISEFDGSLDMTLRYWFAGVGTGIFELQGVIFQGEPFEIVISNPDFCAEVNDGQLDTGVADIGIELPAIMVGAPRCYGFGGLETSIGSWEVNIPPLQLCMKPVQFGQFDLFGLVISIDGLLSTMAGILLVRWVLRS